ncbi:MAG: DUF4910 domain-containing protein [Lachnospiraceae bacterium]|nr:DUF4910 domain-containing protein [Lachnospiraceae bacterium]
MSNTDGQKIYDIAGEIFPICRSLSGRGVRETFDILKKYADITVTEVPTGTEVFDWTVPREWEINDAYIENEAGEKIIDFKKCNLHVMGYSAPVDEWVDLDELLTHVYTEPGQPEAIPYITSYYKERYGFCMSENTKNSLKPGKYHMYIDSRLFEGSLSYGEIVIPGESEEEILFTTYVCHPSMANNECSGPATAVYIADYIKRLPKRKYTYRFVFNPETIGSITYISRNLEHLKSHVKAAFNLSCVGDNLDYSIVHSKYGNTFADKALTNILTYHDKFSDYSFLERGSDERQYNAPGVDIPMVTFCRSKFTKFPEYHTSLDNMDFVSPEGFQGTFDVLRKLVNALENNGYYKVNVLCEPQLGKRGLYPSVSRKGQYDTVMMLTSFIAYSDGRNDLFDISNITHIPTEELIEIKDKLVANGLIDINDCAW